MLPRDMLLRRSAVMILLWIAVLLLAFANGVNDNAKGVVTLRGSGLITPPVAILEEYLAMFQEAGFQEGAAIRHLDDLLKESGSGDA